MIFKQLLILTGISLVLGCGGASSNTTDDTATSRPSPPNMDEANPPNQSPAPTPKQPPKQSPKQPPASPPDSADDNESQQAFLDRHTVANQCFTIGQQARFISADDDNYRVTDNIDTAATFFLKPTALEHYLLLSDYQRQEGEQGIKSLLGLADPNGDLLDAVGNFIGEVGAITSGVGDLTEAFSDGIVLPVSGVTDVDAPRLRLIGEQISNAGEIIASQTVAPMLGMQNRASDLSVWKLMGDEIQGFTLQASVTAQFLAINGDNLILVNTLEEASLFDLVPVENCAEYPEVSLNATVNQSPANFLKEVDRFNQVTDFDNDDVFGFVDSHSHISAYEFIGGRINYGDPFHKFGIDHALHDCEENHGPQGLTGVVEAVTTDLTPHETQGWPSFNYWPRNNSLQHHQSYYRWIERTHLAGMKILVIHLVHNEVLCQLNPQKQNDCDAMPTILQQAQLMYDMQDYIDAQNGGPGEGFFRIVTDPTTAREVIADGKLAVLLGVEMSKVLNCGEFLDVPECTPDQIVERLDQLYDVGVRSMFPVHKFDNAFGGHKPDFSSPAGIGGVLYAGNLGETGHPIEYEECPDDPFDTTDNSGILPNEDGELLNPFGLIEQLLFQLDYLGSAFPNSPEQFAQFDPRSSTGNRCNARGLHPLGEFLINELMKRNMLIEVDHSSRKAAFEMLEITGAKDYPVINSHGGWSHIITRNQILQQGGFANPFGNRRDSWIRNFLNYGTADRPEKFRVGPFGGVGFASDVNGIASLPSAAPKPSEDLYPFTSIDGRVVFDRQQTGDKVFDLYEGRGVAHYGLYPDQIADMDKNASRKNEEEETSTGFTDQQIERAIGEFFTSAEAYLRMWERAAAVNLTD